MTKLELINKIKEKEKKEKHIRQMDYVKEFLRKKRKEEESRV
jgi:hypothetical protein